MDLLTQLCAVVSEGEVLALVALITCWLLIGNMQDGCVLGVQSPMHAEDVSGHTAGSMLITKFCS